MKRQSAVFVVIAAMFATVMPQSLPEARRKAAAFVANGEAVQAVDFLLEEKARDPKGFAAADLDYLLARAAESVGQMALAAVNDQSTVERGSPLAPHALGHLARLARQTGNLMLERIYLRKLAAGAPDSPVAFAVPERLARNSLETGNYAETIRILTSANVNSTSSPPPVAYRREREALLAEAYMLAGRIEDARRAFAGILDKMPNPAQPDDHARFAAKALDTLDGGTEKKAPELDEAEHLRRAWIYQFNREFRDARLHYEAVIANSSANAADAVFQIGRGYSQSGEYLVAMKWYERLLERYPESPIARDALLQAAAAYSRVGKPKEAITRYENYIEKYPTDEKLDRAYLNIVDIIRDQGLDQEALKWCLKTEQAFRGRPVEAVAIFTEARIYISREEWAPALAALERLGSFADLGGATIPGGTSAAEVAFLRAYILEMSGRIEDAVDAYLAIPDGRVEYYGGAATVRLLSMAKKESAAAAFSQKLAVLSDGLKAKDADLRRRSAQSMLRITELPDLRERALTTLKAAIKGLPQYSAVAGARPASTVRSGPQIKNEAFDRLTALGLYDDAILEMPQSVNTVEALRAFSRGGRADRVIAAAEPVWKKVPADLPAELIPADQAEALYPVVYRDELRRAATERRVDPRLLLAIMRQESRFQPDARSNAAARGLMQFIPATSSKIAGELGVRGFVQDDLYDPATAILFGSQYLSSLFKTFHDQQDAVVASYNGGEDNVKRWLARARSNEPERFVPELMFTQTKDYVQKVMAGYRMYKAFYTEDLKPLERRRANTDN